MALQPKLIYLAFNFGDNSVIEHNCIDNLFE